MGAAVNRWLAMRSVTTTSQLEKSACDSDAIRLITLVPWSGNNRTSSVAESQGLRLSLRLWGGQGRHRLQGTLSCKGLVRVRGLQGATSRAALPGLGTVAVLLENEAGRPALVDLEFLKCPVTSIRLDLKLDGRPLQAKQMIVGPYGLRLLRAPLFLGATASMANIGGTASAPVVAAAFHPSLAPVGLVMAILGSVIGTPVALLIIGKMCAAISGG